MPSTAFRSDLIQASKMPVVLHSRREWPFPHSPQRSRFECSNLGTSLCMNYRYACHSKNAKVPACRITEGIAGRLAGRGRSNRLKNPDDWARRIIYPHARAACCRFGFEIIFSIAEWRRSRAGGSPQLRARRGDGRRIYGYGLRGSRAPGASAKAAAEMILGILQTRRSPALYLFGKIISSNRSARALWSDEITFSKSLTEIAPQYCPFSSTTSR